jgi:CTP synthase
MKYVIITGGVISGLGKGITASSIGLLLKKCGFNITAIKIDPYLNVDAGTMSPFEHGECYVLEDGSECDLDLGNYERFLEIKLTDNNSITTGKIYNNVIKKEREGVYLGKTVQVVPHITNEIIECIKNVTKNNNYDFCLIELGGTVGDIESMPFIEALRILNNNDENECCFIHVSLVPKVSNNEYKTKPTQHSIKELNSLGIVPNFVVLRCEGVLDDSLYSKISNSSLINKNDIILNSNVFNIYEVPKLFFEQKFHIKILNKFNNNFTNCNLTDWFKLTEFFKKKNKFKIGIVGKYTGIDDTYLSVIRAIEHASYYVGINYEIIIIDVDNDEISNFKNVKSCDKIIIPGGFGQRGIESMIKVSKYCRENNIPCLGICLGMQVMFIDICRNLLNYNHANSTEFNSETNSPVIDIIPECDIKNKGGSLSLGLQEIKLTPNTQTYEFYENNIIRERFRHRYSINDKFINYNKLYEYILFSGYNTRFNRPDIIELKNHKFFIGCQFHPEFNTSHNNPNPLFIGLLQSII